MNKFKLTPSLMTCNLLNVEKEIIELQKLGIDWYHFDLMDGKYVPNLGMCPDLLEQIKTKFPEITIDVHCMVNDLKTIYDRIKLADYITFHLTSQQEGILDIINFLKKHQKKIGIAIELADDLKLIDNELILNEIDLITIMSIKAGFAGQQFKEETWVQIEKIKKIIAKANHKILLQLDGGIRLNNIEKIIKTDLDLLVVGAMLFHSDNYQKTIQFINELGNE